MFDRKAYARDWYLRNKEKVKERNRAHYQANQEAHRAKAQRWQEANPERAKELQREYRDRNRAEVRERGKKHYRENKDRALAQSRVRKLKRYALTPESYAAMLAAQGGRCKICGSTKAVRTGEGSFSVDHCHETGKVRGLLCRRCNAALGGFRDSPELLEMALVYLRNSSSGAT